MPLYPASTVTSATAFPASPQNGDRVYRTDRNIGYQYNSSTALWLSEQLFQMPIGTQSLLNPITVGNVHRAANPGYNTYALYVEEWQTTRYTTVSSSASYWVFDLSYSIGNGSPQALGSTSANTSQNDTTSAWVSQKTTVGAQIPITAQQIALQYVETGTANSFIMGGMQYRLVG